MINENMSCQEILEHIARRKLKGVMAHADMADIFNLMNLHGFKRKHEYQSLKENAELMSLKRYITERYKVIPDLKGASIDINPMDVKKVGTRDNITRENKSKITYELFKNLVDWENETLDMLQKAYVLLLNREHIADSIKISKLIKDTDKELKYYRRDWIKLNDINWDLTLITISQHDLHEEYREKTEKIYKLEFN
ncbi:MAG: hypothetical protein ACRC7S_16905 [Cetobacterium sp.]